MTVLSALDFRGPASLAGGRCPATTPGARRATRGCANGTAAGLGREGRGLSRWLIR
jgi:hypothetical protein